MKLEPPLRFRVRPGALRARIAKSHPGASPSAGIPEGPVAGIRSLARIAAGNAEAGQKVLMRRNTDARAGAAV
jgi:hypothetical protein